MTNFFKYFEYTLVAFMMICSIILAIGGILVSNSIQIAIGLLAFIFIIYCIKYGRDS